MPRGLAFLALLGLPAFAAAGQGPARQKVAVMDIRPLKDVPEGTAAVLTDIAVAEVADMGRFDVISKADIASMIGFERQKQMMGCSEDSSCLAEIGGALGVDYMVTGQVGKIGSRYRISVLLVDAKRAKVVGRSSLFCEGNEDALANETQKAVRLAFRGVSGGVLTGEPPPPAGLARTRAPSTPTGPGAVAVSHTQATAADAAPADQVSRSSGGGFWSSPIAIYGSIGAGVALVVGGAVEGSAAKSLYDTLQKEETTLSSAAYQLEYDQKSQTIKQQAMTADILFAGGAIVAGFGTYLWLRHTFWESSSGSASSQAPGGPASASAAGSAGSPGGVVSGISIVPVAGGGVGGAVLSGRF